MKNKRKMWALMIGGILLVILAVVLCFVFCRPAEKEPERPIISHAAAATMEFAGDTGYKLITSEIGTLRTFDTLLLQPSEEEFSGEWVYRLVFNPKAMALNGEEIIVLFGEKNLSINGKTYTGVDGVDYADILDWAAGKYQYFDYELIPYIPGDGMELSGGTTHE